MNRTIERGSRRWLVGLGGVAALTMLAGGAAQAQRPEPFTLTGLVFGMDQGDVRPAGRETVQPVQLADGRVVPMLISQSGRYVVRDRYVGGVVTSGPGAGGRFHMTYGGNVELLSQGGRLHAVIQGDVFEARAQLRSQFGGPCTDLLAPFLTGADAELICTGGTTGIFNGIYVTGTATFTDGVRGHGVAQGWLIPILDPLTGHVAAGFGAFLIDVR